MTGATFARSAAVAVAVLAAWDPAVPVPRAERPLLRVRHRSDAGQPRVGDVSDPAAVRLTQGLRNAGFAVNVPVDAGDHEVATILIGDRVASLPSRATPIWALDTAPASPNVWIAVVTAPRARLPGQAIDVRVAVDADGVVGKTTELVIEDSGIPVASMRHQWTATERWNASLQYLPPGPASGRLRVRAIPLGEESSLADNVVDIDLPAVRGPIRTLVAELGVTWPAMFTRRALEGEPAFSVAALQRAARQIATRAGAPPTAIARGALSPFDVVIVGGPDTLTPTDIAALRWFVEERGGVLVLVPDQRPAGRYVDLLGGASFEPRALEQPARLGGGQLHASELLIARSLPSGSRVLAATDSGEPIIFSARRGAGALIFSGALDAWRYRDDGFQGFWRRVILDEAATVPPALEVTVEPALVAIGDAAHVSVRLRGTELPSGDRVDAGAIAARAVGASGRADVPVRLWPTAEPGVYEGTFRPSSADNYDVTVTTADRRGDGRVTASTSIARAPAVDPDGLARAAHASGGRVFRAAESAALVDAIARAYPARSVTRARHPMRSAWWVVPFAGLLCVEWAQRRRRGRP